MSQQTHTVPTEEDSLLTIPWFLDCRNPEVQAKREASAAKFAKIQKEAADKRATAPAAKKIAKSVKTAPAATKPEKPMKVVKAPTPAVKKPGAFADDAVITVLTDDFKHREGSQAESKSALFANGQTVAEYVAAGEGLKLKSKWQMLHIKNAVAKGQIKVDG